MGTMVPMVKSHHATIYITRSRSIAAAGGIADTQIADVKFNKVQQRDHFASGSDLEIFRQMRSPNSAPDTDRQKWHTASNGQQRAAQPQFWAPEELRQRHAEQQRGGNPASDLETEFVIFEKCPPDFKDLISRVVCGANHRQRQRPTAAPTTLYAEVVR